MTRQEIFEKLKEKDPTRIIDATSGWFIRKKSDVDSHHVYFKKIKIILCTNSVKQKTIKPL